MAYIALQQCKTAGKECTRYPSTPAIDVLRPSNPPFTAAPNPSPCAASPTIFVSVDFPSVISTQHGAFAYWHAAGAWNDRRRFAFYPHRREVTPREELVELASMVENPGCGSFASLPPSATRLLRSPSSPVCPRPLSARPWV